MKKSAKQTKKAVNQPGKKGAKPAKKPVKTNVSTRKVAESRPTLSPRDEMFKHNPMLRSFPIPMDSPPVWEKPYESDGADKEITPLDAENGDAATFDEEEKRFETHDNSELEHKDDTVAEGYENEDKHFEAEN